MKGKLFLFVLFLILIITSAKSQSDYRMGYLITNELDTIYGLIDFRSDAKNSKTCAFKKDDYSERIEYTPATLIEYRFIDSKYYITKSVEVDNEKRLVFVEYLVNGIADLFYFNDGKKRRYLIEKEDGTLVELTNEEKTVYIQGQGELTKNTQKYIGILKAVFSDCPKIQREIDNAELTHKSLTDITKTYHDYICKDNKCIVYEKNISPFTIEIAPTVGYGIMFLKFLNSVYYYSGYDFKESISPVIGFSAKGNLTNINEKLFLQLDASLSKRYFYGYYFTKGDLGDEHYDTHNRSVILNTSFGPKYIYTRNKFRPSFGFGLMSNYIFNNKSYSILEAVIEDKVQTYESNYIPLAKFQAGGFIQIGCEYHIFRKSIFFTDIKYGYTIGTKKDIDTTISSLLINFGIYL